MGFLNEYLEQNNLGPVSSKMIGTLDSIESKMQEKSKVSQDQFDWIIKKFAPEILLLIKRASRAFQDEFSLAKLKIIAKIGVEVYQLVDAMQELIITDDMTEEEKKTAKIEFGTELIFFIYSAIDPLKDYLKWLPFKRTLERLVVKWLAEMSLEAAMSLYDSMNDVISNNINKISAMAVNTNDSSIAIRYKVL